MKEYYFLFAITFLWTLAATFQDIKKREVANWLNFSLIAIALSYRAFYAIINKNLQFLIFGILGFVIFFTLANIFYYSKAFAGGDAKLLMSYGIILPYQNYTQLATLSLAFIFLLFTVGALYSLAYSVTIIAQNKTKFKKEFSKKISRQKFILAALIIISLILTAISKQISLLTFLAALLILLYAYTKSLDTCMIVLIPPNKLTEGDWLVHDVKLKNKTIRKTVHGLSQNDIAFLKKADKKVLIKQGIPFIPAFLLSLIIMVFAFLTLQFPFSFLTF